MNIAFARREWSALFACFMVGIGLTVSGCDSGGSSDGGDSVTPTIDDEEVSKIGQTATVSVESSGSKAGTDGGGSLIVVFFYGTDSNGNPCKSAATATVAPPSTKKMSPSIPGCKGNTDRTGIQISFVPLSSSSGGITLDVRNEDGEVVASSSSSSGQVASVEGGSVPVEEAESGGNEPDWVGTWNLTSIDGETTSNTVAWKFSKTRLSGAFTVLDNTGQDTGACGTFSDPITERDGNVITAPRDDGVITTYELSVSNNTLTGTLQNELDVEAIETFTAEPIDGAPFDFVDCTIDNTAPRAPSGLEVTAGDGTASLTWEGVSLADKGGRSSVLNSRAPSGKAAAKLAQAGFSVYRATSEIEDVTTRTPINGVPLQSTSFTDEGVENGTTYHYVVTAIDNNGNESTPSNEETVTPSGSDDGGGGANFPSSLTGKWEVTSTTQSDVDLSSSDIFWEITSSQIEITIEGTAEGVSFCQTDDPESIVSVDGNTITTDDGDGDAPSEATFDITNGGDKLTVEGINGETVEATRVSSIPECS